LLPSAIVGFIAGKSDWSRCVLSCRVLDDADDADDADDKSDDLFPFCVEDEDEDEAMQTATKFGSGTKSFLDDEKSDAGKSDDENGRFNNSVSEFSCSFSIYCLSALSI
jgi:hypothetical protein